MKQNNLNHLSIVGFEDIFSRIINLEIDEDSIKEFLLDLNDANLPSNAFIAAVNILRSKMKRIKAPQDSIDLCGTGGDGLNSLNVSTAVSFVVAAGDVAVAKHGNKAISSKSGSADIFQELGVKVSDNIAEIEESLQKNNLCFLFAPFFHEALKNLAQIRKSLGVPTIFNFLGPLLNPANTNFQLIGVAKRNVMPKMAEVIAQNKNAKAYIVHGFDGMDEITICDNSYLIKVENGKVFDEEIINPEDYGFKKVKIDEIKGQDPKYNAQKLLELLAGKESAYRDIVILNSAFAFKLMGKVKNIEDGIELSRNLITTHKAQQILTLSQ